VEARLKLGLQGKRNEEGSEWILENLTTEDGIATANGMDLNLVLSLFGLG
jgi:hypothetical protein